MIWCISYYLGAFGMVWLPYKTRCKRAKLVQSSCHEVASEFFATNAPDPPHWTQNLCFGVIRTIWVHLGPFGCHTNLCAKWAELVQNFENEVASEFFAPNAPIHPIGPQTDLLVHFILFGCIWDRLVALRDLVQNRPN